MSPSDINSPVTGNLPLHQEQRLLPRPEGVCCTAWEVAPGLRFRHRSSPSVKPLKSLLPDPCVHAKALQSGLTLCNFMGCSPAGPSVHGILWSRTLEWVCHSLLQGVFPTQRSNPGLLHCRQILYHLSHQGSPFRHHTFGFYHLKSGLSTFWASQVALAG